MPALAYAKAAAHAACRDDFTHARHVQRRLTTFAPPKKELFGGATPYATSVGPNVSV
jgi:hypothetical protein